MARLRVILPLIWAATLLSSCCLDPASASGRDSGNAEATIDSGAPSDAGIGVDSGLPAGPDDGGSACTYPTGEAVTPGGVNAYRDLDMCSSPDALERILTFDGGTEALICPACSDADSRALDTISGRCGAEREPECSALVFECYLDAGPALLSKNCAAAIVSICETVLDAGSCAPWGDPPGQPASAGRVLTLGIYFCLADLDRWPYSGTALCWACSGSDMAALLGAYNSCPFDPCTPESFKCLRDGGEALALTAPCMKAVDDLLAQVLDGGD